MDQEVGQMESFTKRAMQIHALYDEFNLSARGRAWSREESMLGFVGDVGDLAKIVMALEGVRSYPAVSLDGALAHELADCLWSVLVLARLYGVDLEQAFTQTMSDLETQIGSDLQRPQTEVNG
ncbi:MazG nucleotide pyrophosphohydrolase domain-containing protein [Streptomyces sp. NPDC002215]|uniref:MazG nucleotide pyrophosphohydrolase domain-containing protein n=1 Tax=Streptomyces sp. NPDC002215 TaxID=3154412 RepID=UPI00331B2A61